MKYLHLAPGNAILPKPAYFDLWHETPNRSTSKTKTQFLTLEYTGKVDPQTNLMIIKVYDVLSRAARTVDWERNNQGFDENEASEDFEEV